jgi:hypothetical protein
MNPYELGRKNGLAWIEAGKLRQASLNPFLVFSAKWALYNHGFNSTWMSTT